MRWYRQSKRNVPKHAELRKQQTGVRMQVGELLMSWACLAEQVLRSADTEEELAKENSEYLASHVSYQDGKLLDSKGEAVMMQWEEPIMKAHANLICQGGGDILNVGFGMGIIDAAIQGCVQVHATN
jgi:hypothetical protein